MYYKYHGQKIAAQCYTWPSRVYTPRCAHPTLPPSTFPLRYVFQNIRAGYLRENKMFFPVRWTVLRCFIKYQISSVHYLNARLHL